jgi:hypothetical protein
VRKSRECGAQANSYRRDICEVVCRVSAWFCSSVLRNVAKEQVDWPERSHAKVHQMSRV